MISSTLSPLVVNTPERFPPIGRDPSSGFLESFVSSCSVIAVSEIGDKTFFMAAIFAMKFSRPVVFAGCLSALTLMTVLSAFLGYATTILSRVVTRLISALLFMIFGLKMFHEGYYMEPDESIKGFQNVEEELEKKQELMLDVETPSEQEEAGVEPRAPGKHAKLFRSFFSPVFVQSFILTFLAEWGDRSQLATIILAARNNLTGVLLGGVFGHALCTGSAVLAGRFIAQRISLKTVHYVGGLVFILSGFYTLILE